MRFTLIPAVSALALLAACQGAPAYAQNLPPSGLPARGAVAGTDVIVDQPAGSATVQGAQASAIATYVANNLGTPAFNLSNATSLPLTSGVTGALPLANGGTGVTSLAGLKAEVLTSVDSFGTDPTGAADSTSAWNTALASGLPLTCQGTYKVHGTGAGILNVTSVNNQGQRVVGGGSSYGAGGQSAFAPATTGACVIRPDSTSTGAVFLIDGAGFPGGGAGISWLQGFGLENLACDLTNMSDVATNACIVQIQAWDVTYNRVRVIGDGVNKRAYLAKAGAYTSSLINFEGHIVDLEGTSSANAVTTIALINSDIGRIIGNYANFISLTGGAVQPVYDSGTMTPVYLASGSSNIPPALSAGCASGCYAIPAVTVTNSDSWTFSTDIEIPSGAGFPATYNDGTHGSLNALPGIVVPSTWTRVSLLPGQVSGMYLFDYSGSTFSLGANAGGGSPYNLVDAPTTFTNGWTIPGSSKWSVNSAQSLPGLGIRPASDAASITYLANAANTDVYECYTYGTGGCNFNDQANLFGWSDYEGTHAWALTIPSSGNGLFTLYGSGTAKIILTGANGTISTTGGVTATAGYTANGVAGVSCAAGTVSLTTLVVTIGIVTHC
jgi:hypothetical protein